MGCVAFEVPDGCPLAGRGHIRPGRAGLGGPGPTMGSRAPVSCKSWAPASRPAQSLHPRPPPNVCTSIKAAGRARGPRREAGSRHRSPPARTSARGCRPPATLPNSLARHPALSPGAPQIPRPCQPESPPCAHCARARGSESALGPQPGSGARLPGPRGAGPPSGSFRTPVSMRRSPTAPQVVPLTPTTATHFPAALTCLEREAPREECAQVAKKK